MGNTYTADSATPHAPDVYKKLENFPPLKVGKDLSRDWCTWKLKLLSFLRKKNVYEKQWIQILWMAIGPVGEQAARAVRLRDGNQAQDFELLLLDLDVYFILGSRKKRDNESIEQYIDSLTLLAIVSNHNDPVSVVKEKLVQDIADIKFMGEAVNFVRSKGENLLLHLQQLSLSEIALFWRQCEELMTQSRDNRSASRSAETGCVRCGTHHARNRCPAYGRRCDRCKEYNHFAEHCRARYVTDCPKCGTSHFQSRCIAYGTTCGKCGKTNHFSSFCTTRLVEDCPRCGQNHAVSACPAINKTCPRCNKPNHLENKCISRSNIPKI